MDWRRNDLLGVFEVAEGLLARRAFEKRVLTGICAFWSRSASASAMYEGSILGNLLAHSS